ncbi:MAG: histidine--tRNA ligase [Planctomycetaceae bacterium]|nr:histidine--tRNA ligase [Planctomycetaceae bacterium]
MAKVNIDPVSGFPEWLPGARMEELRLIDVIRHEYELYGFAPIETPAIERLEVLLSKGGMQRQIFSLGRPSDDEGGETLGLHFDLTVPLARYVVQRSNELTFPFRRYQIQKVWRGERAQRGRFREFYQCDIDIIGRESLDVIQDAEIVAVINSTLQSIRTATKGRLPDYKIHLNNRKILSSLFSSFGITGEAVIESMRIIDKMPRDGKEVTESSLKAAGLSNDAVSSILNLVCCKSLEEAKTILTDSKANLDGIIELTQVVEHAKNLGVPVDGKIVLEFGIARGLDYYTGTVYETFIDGKREWGSICSGGRYDDLASYFTTQKFPGVGVSIGLSRLFDLMVQSNILDVNRNTPTDVLVTAQDRDKYLADYLGLAKTLREAGINTEVFLNDLALREQIAYAANKGIPLVVIAGGEELSEDTVSIKDLRYHTQDKISGDEMVRYIKAKISAR